MIPTLSRLTRLSRRSLAMAVVVVLAAASLAVAQPADVERFSATTTGMRPDGEGLRIDVLRWSSDEERAKAVSVIGGSPAAADADTSPDPAELQRTLDALPTVGYIWPSSSSLGISIKYATRTERPGGGELITLATIRRLGAYALQPWTATTAPRAEAATEPFTVIVLRLNSDGTGDGTMSLAAEPVFDTTAGTVSLAQADTAPVLLSARRGQSPASGN